jgi:hypothetical protein
MRNAVGTRWSPKMVLPLPLPLPLPLRLGDRFPLPVELCVNEFQFSDKFGH